MEKITIGSYIQQIRMDKGWSQDYLCSGICERSTLSRIENGQRSPSVGILTRLLERLGVSTERVIIMLDKGDIVMENLQKQVRNDTIRFEKAREEDKPAIRAQILADLDRLEEQAGEDERFIRQFILGARATVGGPEGPYSARERLQLLTEAIKLTVPRFSLKQIGRFRYSTEEMTLINQIARTYARSGDRNTSMDISRRLLQYIEENGQGLDKYARQFTLVAHNYAIDLGLEKRYEEAERLARRGWDICVTSLSGGKFPLSSPDRGMRGSSGASGSRGSRITGGVGSPGSSAARACPGSRERQTSRDKNKEASLFSMRGHPFFFVHRQYTPKNSVCL